jgi:beta-glucosidase
MAFLFTILSGLLLLAVPIDAQVYMGEERSSDAFTWVQPLNTTILGQYGHSEPVYPSRMLMLSVSGDNHYPKLNG